MKKVGILSMVLTVVLILGISTSPWAGSGPRIGYFDLEKVMKTSKWGQDIQQKLKAEETKLESQLKEKREELQKFREDFKKTQAMLGAEAKKKKIMEFEKKRREGEQFIAEANRKMQRLSAELTRPMLEKIFDIVKEIAKKEKVDFVFEARRSGLIYAEDKYDLTSKIIKELDKQYKKK